MLSSRTLRLIFVAAVLSSLVAASASAVTYTWNGGTAAWNVSTNWTPNRPVAAASDVLVFNGGGPTTATNVPTETIGQLLVSNNTNVTLQSAGAVTVTISGNLAGNDLQVDAGSQLNFTGTANAITMNVAATAAGSISGSMTLSGTAAVAHRLTAAAASGITFQSGATFTQGTNHSGNVFGAGTANSVVFASGSTFNFQSGSNPFALGQPASVVVFQTGSLYRQQSSNTPSFSGRTYANFEMVSGTVSPVGTAAVSVDNLTVTGGTLNWNMTATPGHSIKGNISVAVGGTLNFAPASAGTLNLNGGAAQSITNAGTLTINDADQTININNANGITLGSNVIFNAGTLTFTSGNIITGPNMLIINSGANVNRTSGHVIGNLNKQFSANGSKVFEVGTANGYSPFTANVTAGTPGSITCAAVQGPQPNMNPATSIQRYWILTASALINADLTFVYLDGDVMGNEAIYEVYRVSGGVPTAQTASVVNAGTNTATLAGVSSFSDWTVGEFAPALPLLTVTDVSQTETDGATTFTFQVNLDAPAPGNVTFDVATADGTAQDDNPVSEDNDYVQIPTTPMTITTGNSSASVAVTVNGDIKPEADETFFVNVTNISGAVGSDTTGQGTIQNNDVACADLSITDVTQVEGDAGTSTFAFTVALSQAGCGTVTFDIATANGTATTADNDYVTNTLTGQTVTFGAPYTFNVTVNGDTTQEPDQTFFVNITNVSPLNVGLPDTQGLGTILNDDFTRIHDIQGPGAATPIIASVVTTRGIVTGRKTNGYFIQEPDASVDANPLTSEGIFVFTSSAPPAAAAVGNLVEVTGTVAEFVPGTDPFQPPLTELTSPTTVQLSTGNPLPAAIALSASCPAAGAGSTCPGPTGNFDQLERYEGMRVSVASLTVGGPTLGNVTESTATATSTGVFFGTVTGVPRAFREPGIPDPDPAPSGGGTIPPIPRFDSNPEVIRVDSDGLPGATLLDVSTSAVVTGLVGPLDYGFRHYTILPDAAPALPPVVAGGMTPVAAAVPLGTEFTVGAYNLERFYDDVNDPGGDTVINTSAYNNRLNKASLGIRNFLRMPDILGVIEVEKLSVLQALATKINNDAVAASQPNPMYVAYLIEGNDPGLIDVGFLVKTAIVTGSTPRVTVNGGVAIQENAGELFVNPDSSTTLLHDRPFLRLDAIINDANGAAYPVTVINVHNRSLNNANDEGPGSNGWATEGARVRAKRQKQAESLANLVQARQTATPTENIIVLGDYNAFEFNDGLGDSMNVITGTPTPDNQTAVPGDGVDLVNPNLDNLFDTAPAPERYSFVFDGNAQSLDHVVVNAALIASTAARRLEHPRINADFAEEERDNPATALRLADHDPVVGYFQVAGFAEADVSLTKTLDTAGPYIPGQSVSYTIVVTNNGPDAATNINVTDTPTNLTITSVTGACTSFSPCTIASLAAGANSSITVTATITAPGAFDNSATATATQSDPNASNNTGNDGDTAAASADVSVVKTLTTGGPYIVGQSVSFTIDVSNAGPSTATNINVTDTPTNLTITGVSGACASFSPCTIASLTPSGMATINVTATINAAVAFDNSATATAAEADPNASNNTGNDGDTAGASANVSVVKTLTTSGPYNVGQSITYTIDVSNAGPSTATNINVTDTPTNLTITNVSGACTSFSPCTIASLTPGSTTTINVTATITTVGAFDNEASATPTETDPDLSNNTDNTGNGGTASGLDLSVQKNLTTAGPYYIGQLINYTIQVENNGPDTATNINVTDTPTNLSIVSVTGSGCTSLPCTIPGPLTAGGSTFIFVDATIISVGAFDNSVTVTAAQAESNPANNTDNTGNGGTAVAAADVSMTKTLNTAGPYFVGQTISYTLTVANAGASTATNINVTDTPSNLTITSVSGACASFPCTIASLASGANAVINMTATITAAGIFDNSATATATEFDPNTNNNTDNTGNGGTTGNAADLSVAKSIITPAPYHQGDSVQFQIVVSNAGPNTATNVVVTDTPIGVTITNVTGSGCTSFPCTIPSLAMGANTTITLTGTIQNPGSFDNSTTVSATEFDPNTSNNQDLFGNGGVAQNTVDVAITKTLNTPGPYVAGQSITYTLVVSNAGPGVALFVVVTDTPTNLTITSVSGAGCTSFPCTLVPGVTPTPASNRTITVTATINAVGPFDNSATATQRSSDFDPNPANNTDNTGNGGIAVAPSVDLALTKTASAQFVQPGQQFDYILTLVNNGPGTATNVVVTDTLPANFTFVSATSTQGTCSGTTTVTCNVGTMLNGATVTITIRGTAGQGGTYSNTATATATEGDFAAANNTANAVVHVPGNGPTLSEWALILLALMLAFVAMRKI